MLINVDKNVIYYNPEYHEDLVFYQYYSNLHFDADYLNYE